MIQRKSKNYKILDHKIIARIMLHPSTTCVLVGIIIILLAYSTLKTQNLIPHDISFCKIIISET